MILLTGGCLPQCILASWETPPAEQTPPPGSRHPPVQSMLGDTVNARAVRILLECNLVDKIDTRWETSVVQRHVDFKNHFGLI